MRDKDLSALIVKSCSFLCEIRDTLLNDLTN